MTVYTIGFTKKTAQEFFTILQDNNIEKLIDIRLNNVSQLAAFTKAKDLKYFLKQICDITYYHNPMLSPTKEILDSYKKKTTTWADYETEFDKLLNQRFESNEYTDLTEDFFNNSVLLCSEPKADQCHRRLVAEFFQRKFPNMQVKHL